MAVNNNGVFVWVSKKCKGPFGLAVTQPQGVFASGSQQPGAFGCRPQPKEGVSGWWCVGFGTARVVGFGCRNSRVGCVGLAVPQPRVRLVHQVAPQTGRLAFIPAARAAFGWFPPA
ncbi:hypothetical protein Tco_0607041 [Tanacetum coccineum]